MKATLEYDLDNAEDREAHMRVIKSTDMAIAIFEFQTNSRKKLESRLENIEVIDDILDIVYGEFTDILEENDINIDKLIS